MQLSESPKSELDFATYQERQYTEVSQPAIQVRLEHLGIGNRSRWNGGSWEPQPYPGFALQAMVDATHDNDALANKLLSLQDRVVATIQRPGVLYPLPVSSFHQTVANTFSADRLSESIVSKDLLDKFPKLIDSAFQSLEPRHYDDPPRMRLIGISVFRTALGILGVFPDKNDFDRVISFRDSLYSRPDLTKIGLKRTRPFIGHITLAYVEDSLDTSEKIALSAVLESINADLSDRPLLFSMPKAELRLYDTLSAFEYDPAFPYFTL